MCDLCSDANVCGDANPCANGGTCVESGKEHTCSCRPGFTGVMCQQGQHRFCQLVASYNCKPALT